MIKRIGHWLTAVIQFYETHPEKTLLSLPKAHLMKFFKTSLKSQLRPARKMFVYKIQVNPIHTILRYGDYYDFMDK